MGFTGDYMVQVPFAVFQAYERVEFVAVVLIAQRWVTTTIAIVGAVSWAWAWSEWSGIYCVGSLARRRWAP